MLSPEEQAVVDTVRDWVDAEVRPVARDLEHANTYPAELIEHMRRLGVFGLAIPEEYGGAPVSTPCFALVTEELARGWMTLAGGLGGRNGVGRVLLLVRPRGEKRRGTPRARPPGVGGAAGRPRTRPRAAT